MIYVFKKQYTVYLIRSYSVIGFYAHINSISKLFIGAHLVINLTFNFKRLLWVSMPTLRKVLIHYTDYGPYAPCHHNKVYCPHRQKARYRVSSSNFSAQPEK